MTGDPDPRDGEEYEFIPWTQLAPPRRPLPTRLAAWAAGAVLAVAVAWLGAGLLRTDPGGVTVALSGTDAPATTAAPTAPPSSSSLVETVPTVVTTEVGEAPEPIDDAVLYSEADLMAILPEEEQRAAAARAEWFVTDYFTRDGDQSGSQADDHLPEGVVEAQPAGDSSGGVSYVEWARATMVAPAGPARHEVTVTFRRLAGTDAASLHRLPVEAVLVTVVTTGDGEAVVTDLPVPATVTSPQASTTLPENADPPPEVVAAAFDAVAGLGEAVRIERAGIDDHGWRVVVSVVDASGWRWPYVVRPED